LQLTTNIYLIEKTQAEEKQIAFPTYTQMSVNTSIASSACEILVFPEYSSTLTNSQVRSYEIKRNFSFSEKRNGPTMKSEIFLKKNNFIIYEKIKWNVT